MTDYTSPRTSVVVGYNGERFLSPCLESHARNGMSPAGRISTWA
jgi:hypothetical protein